MKTLTLFTALLISTISYAEDKDGFDLNPTTEEKIAFLQETLGQVFPDTVNECSKANGKGIQTLKLKDADVVSRRKQLGGLLPSGKPQVMKQEIEFETCEKKPDGTVESKISEATIYMRSVDSQEQSVMRDNDTKKRVRDYLIQMGNGNPSYRVTKPAPSSKSGAKK